MKNILIISLLLVSATSFASIEFAVQIITRPGLVEQDRLDFFRNEAWRFLQIHRENENLSEREWASGVLLRCKLILEQEFVPSFHYAKGPRNQIEVFNDLVSDMDVIIENPRYYSENQVGFAIGWRSYALMNNRVPLVLLSRLNLDQAYQEALSLLNQAPKTEDNRAFILDVLKQLEEARILSAPKPMEVSVLPNSIDLDVEPKSLLLEPVHFTEEKMSESASRDKKSRIKAFLEVRAIDPKGPALSINKLTQEFNVSEFNVKYGPIPSSNFSFFVMKLKEQGKITEGVFQFYLKCKNRKFGRSTLSKMNIDNSGQSSENGEILKTLTKLVKEKKPLQTILEVFWFWIGQEDLLRKLNECESIGLLTAEESAYLMVR